MRARVALLREGILTTAVIFSRREQCGFRTYAEYRMHIDYIKHTTET